MKSIGANSGQLVSQAGTQPTIHDINSMGNPLAVLQSQNGASIQGEYSAMKPHGIDHSDINTMSPDPNRKPNTTERQHPYLSMRSKQRGVAAGVGGQVTTLVGQGPNPAKGVYNSVDADKYRMQYNSSSIPYL